MCGTPDSCNAVPWFWSDHYDTSLQIAVLSPSHDETVVRGKPADGAFGVFYLKKGRLPAVDAINSPREYMRSRTPVAAGARPITGRIGDPASPLRKLTGPRV